MDKIKINPNSDKNKNTANVKHFYIVFQKDTF